MSVLARSAALAVVLLALGATAGHAAITPTITEFGDGSITLNSAATGIALGPDGNIYISEFNGTNGNRLARVTPDGTVTELPPFTNPSRGVQNLVTGPDGKMYLTEASADSIGIFDPANPDTIVEHTTPTTGSNPHEITVGPDGNIWFTEADDNRIAEFSTADPATIHTFPSGGLGAAEPYGITTGPDGAIWFAERSGNAIGRLDPANPNNVETFNTGIISISRPRMIAAGPDGRLWFTQQGTNEIGAIDPVSHVIQEFPLTGTHVNPIGIAHGPDGAIGSRRTRAATPRRVRSAGSPRTARSPNTSSRPEADAPSAVPGTSSRGPTATCSGPRSKTSASAGSPRRRWPRRCAHRRQRNERDGGRHGRGASAVPAASARARSPSAHTAGTTSCASRAA